VNKKPPDLPNIEDATLRACLAPLMDAMNAGVEAAMPSVRSVIETNAPVERSVALPHGTAGSNDNPAPTMGRAAAECVGTPATLAEWKSMADDDFGMFRTIELFLAMTDAELETAAAKFPKQIEGTIARIGRIRRRLSSQYDTVTTVTALLERAISRAAVRRRNDQPATTMPGAGE
jgi:hypothetical protein